MSDKKDHKPLSKEDAELWQKVQQTVDQVNHERGIISNPAAKEPLPGEPEPEDFASMLDNLDNLNTEKNSDIAPAENSQLPPVVRSEKPQAKVEAFDHKAARKISSGKQPIDAAIDLHGLTQREAKPGLINFLRRAQQDNKRNVLVITGKGQKRDRDTRSFELGAPEPGILKREVPNWLDELPEIVISHTKSHQRHGGEGALYVRLRRPAPNLRSKK